MINKWTRKKFHIESEINSKNNQIHSDICRGWLVSEAGRLAKMENPAGYQNVMLHMQRHVKVMQVMSMNAAQETQPQQKEKPIAAQVKQRGQLS